MSALKVLHCSSSGPLIPFPPFLIIVGDVARFDCLIAEVDWEIDAVSALLEAVG
jgi:hypothetical protein